MQCARDYPNQQKTVTYWEALTDGRATDRNRCIKCSDQPGTKCSCYVKQMHLWQPMFGIRKHVDMTAGAPVQASDGEKGLPLLLPELTPARCLCN